MKTLLKMGFWICVLFTGLIVPGLVGAADAQTAAGASAATPPPLDIVTLKDGSIIYGEVIAMEGGILYIKTPASPDNQVKVKWETVAKLTVNHPLPFHLKEGTVLLGTATEGPTGSINVKAEPMKGQWKFPSIQ